MATASDYTRPSVGPLLAPQRQRLEALQFAARLLRPRHNDPLPETHRLLAIARYIETGE